MRDACDASPGAPRAAPRGSRRCSSSLLVVAPLVTVALLSIAQFRPAAQCSKSRCARPAGTAAQLFWTSTWAFSQEDSRVVPLHQHPGEFERLRFPLPPAAARVSPLRSTQRARRRARFGSMRVLDRDGRTVRTIDPMLMLAMHQIDGIVPGGRTTCAVVTTKDANDPMLLMRSSWIAAPPRWYEPAVRDAVVAGVDRLRVRRAGRRGLRVRRRAICAAGRSPMRDGLLARRALPARRWRRSWRSSIDIRCRCRSGISGTAKPRASTCRSATDGLTWHQMFTLHNEHRIFFTRVLATSLLVAERPVGSAAADRRQRGAAFARRRWCLRR